MELSMSVSPHYAREVGDWLGGLAPWDVWFTITTREPRSPAAWRRGMQRFVKRTAATHAFWGIETGSKFGRLHAHGLLHWGAAPGVLESRVPPKVNPLPGDEEVVRRTTANVLRPPNHALWRDCNLRFGRSQFIDYDPSRGAAHYVSKYVSKKMTDWDIHAPRHA